MRIWASLRRLVGALIGALTRRRRRRGGEEQPALRTSVDSRDPPPQIVGLAAEAADSASTASVTPGVDAVVGQPPTTPEAEAPAEVSPGGEATAEPHGDGPVVSSCPAAGSGHESPQVTIESPNAALPVAAVRDESIPEVEATEPASVSTATCQHELSTALETAPVGEPPSSTAVVENHTIAAPDASRPHADQNVDLPENRAPDAGADRELRYEDEEDASVDGNEPTLSEPQVEAVLALDESMDSDAEASGLSDEPWTDDEVLETEEDGEEGNRPPNPLRRRPRAVPTERRPEPFTEYAITVPQPPSADYRTWNRAIAEHLLLNVEASTDLYLTITPRILARVLVEAQGTVLSPEGAEQHFGSAVSGLYRERVLTQRPRLRVLRRNGDDGLPECIGFLALTVLAAYRMRSDEEATGLAYYMRLRELLGCEPSGQYPMGFDPLVFESLWYFLRDWLAHRQGSRLIVPSAEGGIRRFVGLPLAHVPLRSLDINKLPDFFVWAGYEPRSVVTADRLTADFARWVRARGALTPSGVAAFADARRPALLAEIRAELDSWDGTCDESFSRRSAAVEILFDPVQQRPELFYVPRRPSGFPTRFDDGVHTFEASDDGWYGRISVAPQDGGELASGFTWQAPYSGVDFALRRVAASVISLAPSDDFSYSGFMSTRGLRRGVRCAVLCREDVAQVAGEYLSHVTDRPCTPLRHPDLPIGWSLFAGVLARRVADAPAGFESIDVQANVGLIPSGGIRLGNRWTWLHGAPPRIIVTGSEPGLTVTVDGEPATVGEDGVLQSEGPLTGLGAHVIQVGPLRRTVEIVKPSLPVDSIAQRPQSSPSSAPVLLALPAGRWTIVGAVPGRIARAKYGHRAGTIVDSTFVPSWAIRVGPEGAAIVLHVFAGVPPAPVLPSRLRLGAVSTRDYLSWATAIYDVAVRHPRIESLATGCESLALAESWKLYARCAGEIKRQVRRFRR